MINAVKKLLDKPILFHRAFVPFGGVTSALMLSQALYWTTRTKEPDGWFYKTCEEWEEETGMSRHEQDTARRQLKKTGFWEEKLRGLPAKMHYRVDVGKLLTSLSDSVKLDGCEPASESPAIQQTFLKETENTTKVGLLIEVDDIPEKVYKYFDLIRSRSGFKGELKRTRDRERLVRNLLKQKYTLADFQAVINHKFHAWAHTDMRDNLTPETLFRPSNFPKYVEAVVNTTPSNHSWTEQPARNGTDWTQ